MNAALNSVNDFMEENSGGSDSDTNTEESPEYYQPISAGDDVDNDEDISDHSNSDRLSNGYGHCVENGISSLDLRDYEEEKGEEEEEDERTREESDSATLRAFREDESRRNAPLPPENAMRVMEAMRGISFGGLAPDWADRVPENQWINQLRTLRESPVGESSHDHV